MTPTQKREPERFTVAEIRERLLKWAKQRREHAHDLIHNAHPETRNENLAAANDELLMGQGVEKALDAAFQEGTDRGGRERCEKCGGDMVLVWWCHDDSLWEKVTGKVKPVGSRESAGGVLCIQCFDAAARKVCPWIEWAPLNLRHLRSEDAVNEFSAEPPR